MEQLISDRFLMRIRVVDRDGAVVRHPTVSLLPPRAAVGSLSRSRLFRGETIITRHYQAH